MDTAVALLATAGLPDNRPAADTAGRPAADTADRPGSRRADTDLPDNPAVITADRRNNKVTARKATAVSLARPRKKETAA